MRDVGGRDVFPRPVLIYLACGLAALAGFYLLPAGFFNDVVYYPSIGFASAAAIVAGTLWHRPPSRLPWLLIATGVALFAVGDVLFGVYDHLLDATFPSPADGFYLAGYPALAAGLWLLVRQRTAGRDWEALIDAAIVTIALGVVSWEVLMTPYAEDESLTFIEKLFSVAYPLGDILLLAVAVRLFLGTGVRTVAYGFLAAAILCQLVADPLYAYAELSGAYTGGGLLDAGWILSYILWGAAALHPSMRVSAEPAPETAPKLTPLRLALLAAAALTAPVVLAFRPEYAALAGSAVLFLLVLARLAGIVRRHERAVERESALREASATLVAATTDEQIHHAAVETAVGFAGEGARATLLLETERGLEAVATAGAESDEPAHERFPLVIRGEPRGELVVGAHEVRLEQRLALQTLAAQVALALETVARAREKAEAERERVRDMFSRFVPPAVVEELLQDGGAGGLRLGGKTVDGTIMFTDLRKFTTFSEERPAEEVIAVINQFLSEQTETIMAHGGTIIAYLGDGIMAAFGAPIEQPDHADRALAASRDLIGTRLPELNAWMRERGYGDGFRMGIGVNSGTFTAGNVGSERRLEYTAIGDVCNTAARIQDLTKGTRHMLLFSDGTLSRLVRRPDDLVDVGDAEIRGRQAVAKLWSVEGVSDA